MHSLIEIRERPGLRAGYDIDTDEIELILPSGERRRVPAGASPRTRSLANLIAGQALADSGLPVIFERQSLVDLADAVLAGDYG